MLGSCLRGEQIKESAIDILEIRLYAEIILEATGKLVEYHAVYGNVGRILSHTQI